MQLYADNRRMRTKRENKRVQLEFCCGKMRIFLVIVVVQVFTFVNCYCGARLRNMTIDVRPAKSFKNLTGIALESAVIDEISQQMKSNPRIQMRHYEITKITKNMLKNFSGIFSIDLRGNEIAEVEEETFSGNTKLEKIDMMENRLTKITKKLLAGEFEDLQEINFSYNMVASIESSSFDKLPQLESIDLSCNSLKHLHSDLFKKNSELRQVYLQGNDIRNVEHDIFNSKTDLKLLDLSHNELESIPEFEMKKINHFDLSSNKISRLDLNYNAREKKKSANIVELILAFNQISECSELEERRTDILHLDLSHNDIDNLDDFPSFLNLEMLMLGSNNISDLSLHNFPDRFPSLKVLNVRDNPVDCLDYRYVRNNIQTLVVTVDPSIIHRCHHNSSETKLDDYLDDYEGVIINEIRTKNNQLVNQLSLNRSILLILMSMFAGCAMTVAYFALQYRIKLMKRAKGNLIDQIEL